MAKDVVVADNVKFWSYSRFRDWVRCPAYYAYKYLRKLEEPGSKAMEKGSAVGKMAEDFATGKLRKLPLELSLFREQFEAVRARKNRNVWVEQMWYFDKDWNPILHTFPSKGDGGLNFERFGAKDWLAWRSIWLRVKMDLCGLDESNILVPVDHKTGKYRANDIGSYLEQLEIYSIGGLQQQTRAVASVPKLWFLDAGLTYPDDEPEAPDIAYARAELSGLQKKWERKVIPMLQAGSFKAKPNNKCQWCHYRKENGGPCIY